MAATYRVVVTGSRSWAALPVIQAAFAQLADRCPRGNMVVLVNGRGPIVDPAAGRYISWAHALDLSYENQYQLISADWQTFLAGRERGWFSEFHEADWQLYGNQAGHIRNTAMIATGVQECLPFVNACTKRDCAPAAVIRHPTHGGAGCGRRAHAAGVPTTWWAGPDLDGWFRKHPQFTQGRIDPPCPQQEPSPGGVTSIRPEGLLW